MFVCSHMEVLFRGHRKHVLYVPGLQKGLTHASNFWTYMREIFALIAYLLTKLFLLNIIHASNFWTVSTCNSTPV